MELNSVQGIYVRKRNLIYFGKFLRQLVMDSKLLRMGEKVLHYNCSRVLCKGNVFGQNGCSCKKEVFWLRYWTEKCLASAETCSVAKQKMWWSGGVCSSKCFLLFRKKWYSFSKFVCLMCELQTSFQDSWHRPVTHLSCMHFCLLSNIQQEIGRVKVNTVGSYADCGDFSFANLISFILAVFFFKHRTFYSWCSEFQWKIRIQVRSLDFL